MAAMFGHRGFGTEVMNMGTGVNSSFGFQPLRSSAAQSQTGGDQFLPYIATGDTYPRGAPTLVAPQFLDFVKFVHGQVMRIT